MKGIIKKCTALLCSACMVFSASAMSANAKDDAKDSTKDEGRLPSGITYESFYKHIEEDVSEYGKEGFPDMYCSVEAIVFCGDEIISTVRAGEIDRENHIPADENAVYEWGSITKTMVWVSVMQLWEQGKLDLEEDIRTYLPDGFFQHLSYDEPITMLNIMNHTAGWGETTYTLETADASSIRSLEEELRDTEPHQAFRPGEVVAYSNWGASLAGYIVERISGMSFVDYVHKNIFEPLGMEHTAIAADHSDNEFVMEQRKLLKTYEFDIMKGEYSSPLGNALHYITLYPCGAATGTIDDLATYAQAFVDDSHPLFKNKETQEKLFTGTVFNGDNIYSSYGFFASEYYVTAFGHGGDTVACHAKMEFDPVTKYGYVEVKNSDDMVMLFDIMPKRVFGGIPKERYSAEGAEKYEPKGYFIQSRSQHSGILKSLSYLTGIPADMFEAKSLNEGYYQLDDNTIAYVNEGRVVETFGKTHYSDGSSGVRLLGSELIPEKLYIPKILLFAGFLISAFAAVFVLLIKLKLRRNGMMKPYTGRAVLTFGEFAKIIAVFDYVTMLALCMSLESVGFDKRAGTVCGCIQIVCALICTAAAIVSAYGLIAKKSETFRKICYIGDITGNVITVWAILFFEMYKFWGC
ncbi:MAG: beta-lactamase family protein [Ruminococcus sp.]|nr:beta-lactamase family protein [Ruminococcus sp.]